MVVSSVLVVNCEQHDSAAVVPSPGGELEYALFVERESVHSCILLNKALAFPVLVRNVRPLWIRASQKLSGGSPRVTR